MNNRENFPLIGEINVKRDNVYLEMISECKKITNNIRVKAGIIICQQDCAKSQETQVRTELEEKLRGLVNSLEELERDIII